MKSRIFGYLYLSCSYRTGGKLFPHHLRVAYPLPKQWLLAVTTSRRRLMLQTRRLLRHTRLIATRPLSPLSSHPIRTIAITGIDRAPVLEDFLWIYWEERGGGVIVTVVAFGVRYDSCTNERTWSLPARFEPAATPATVAESAGWVRISFHWVEGLVV